MPEGANRYARLNMYVDDPQVRGQVKLAALQVGMTVSAYCLEAIRRRLADEGYLSAGEKRKMTPQEAARDMDRIRKEIGPIGISIRDLINEGRYR